MARTRIELNQKAVRSEILKDEKIAKHIRELAQRIASAAGPNFIVDPGMGKNRANARVTDPTPGSLFREAEQGNLRRAVQGVRR